MFAIGCIDFLLGMFGNVVRGIMYNKRIICQRFDVFGECRPWFREHWFQGSLAFIFFVLLVVTSDRVVVTRLDARNHNRINAMMDMIVSRFFLIFILYAPHLPEFCRCRTLYNSYITLLPVIRLVEQALEIQSCILAYQPDTRSLSPAKSFRHFGHLETSVFLLPVVKFET